MNRKFFIIGSACLATVACFTHAGRAGQAPADRLAAIQKAGPSASITVFPAAILNKPMPQVGDVIGMLLEKAGMDNIETSEVAATVAPDAEMALMTTQFGEFVRNQNIKTDYALFAVFLGTHEAGFTEVRTVIVDSAGAEVWSDRQTKSDADFKRIKPREPMQCCMLVAERVKDALKLPTPPAGRTAPGKIERRFAEKAGMPSDAERSDMAPRLAALKKLGVDATIKVYPIQINGAADTNAATQLMNLLNEKRIFKAQLAAASPVFDLKPSMNEQTRLWDLARASRADAKAHGADSSYTLFAEYMMTPKTNTVGAVHFVICDPAGEWVIVDYQNSHHKDFKRIAPHNADDCGKLVTKRLKGYLK